MYLMYRVSWTTQIDIENNFNLLGCYFFYYITKYGIEEINGVLLCLRGVNKENRAKAGEYLLFKLKWERSISVLGTH